MHWILVALLVGIAGVGIIPAFSQELQLATFQETVQILIDQQFSNNVTASVTLQTTSNQEIRIPSELEQKIRENERIVAVILTNEENCVLGVFEDSCIMINVSRDESEKGIIAIQEDAKSIGNSLIDDVNAVFDTNAKFHSVFVHHRDESNVALETSGVVSGRGTVSAVYTMSREDTQSMYEKISTILLPSVIREAGGFYDIAKKLSSEPNARMTFSIIPIESSSLYQLKLAVDYPDTASELGEKIRPLEFLKTNELKRSDYFSQGFYPLNSLLQVVVLSSEPTHVKQVAPQTLLTEIIGGEKIPTDVTKDGWVFDPDSGDKIDGKYIFGQKFSVKNTELQFALVADIVGSNEKIEEFGIDQSIIVVIIIAVIAGGAAAFYLKGYRK